ncbi:MAG: hypothetical protein NPINA01_23820 [Nitrospinaceae bacterium]|nr:MAG: hypothetical protein NPINA01_23820 [Nitrospinaceae bacterium]
MDDENQKEELKDSEDAPESAEDAPESSEETGDSVDPLAEASEAGLIPSDGQTLTEFDEEEELEFDLEAQIEEFRQQIEEEPDNCVHHYNLGEALVELGDLEEARDEFDLALELDTEKEFTAIIHFAIGNLHYSKLISGIHGTVVRSSVGLHSAHKAGDTITQVANEDYEIPIREFESAIQNLNFLKADEDIVEYVSKNAPQQIADTYYKWASDLIDKSRQIEHYGGEIKDVKAALKHLKKTLDIDPNHSQANLMVKYAKKMLQEGWKAFDEYGFEAKDIPGTG